jgi:hypothetical protein
MATGRDADQRERIEWDRATPERREMLCPLLWTAPFGLVKFEYKESDWRYVDARLVALDYAGGTDVPKTLRN